MPKSRFWCMKMRLLKLIPLFLVLVTTLSIITPAHATVDYNSCKSNTGNITLCASLTVQSPKNNPPSDGLQSFTASYTVTFLDKGQPLKGPNQLSDSAVWEIRSLSLTTENTTSSLTTSVAPDSAIVVIKIAANPASLSTTLTKTIQIVNNTPIQVSLTLSDGAGAIVTLTTNVPENPSNPSNPPQA